MIEFFLEGGRSRTGKLLPPMLGLLNMLVAAALPLERRQVHFFPVSIGYERLMEESAFARELLGGAKTREDAKQLLAASKLLADRFGTVNIQIGKSIELYALRAELGIHDGAKATPAKRRAIVKRLAHQVMDEINQVTAVTPGALVALVLLGHGRRGMAYRDLVDQCLRVGDLLRGVGARISPSLLPRGATSLREQGLVEALRLYVRSGLVEQHVPGEIPEEHKKRARLYTGTDAIFTVPDARRVRLDFAKNHIIHFLVERALVAVALSCPPEEGSLTETTVRERVRSLSRLFKYEFMFRADAPFDRIFDEVLADMFASGEIARSDGAIGAGVGHDGLDGAGWVAFYAAVLRNSLEAYAVAAKSLEQLLKGSLSKKDLVARALKNGQRMFLRGEIERSEANARPTMENAFDAFVDQGYLVRKGDDLALAQSFCSAAGVQAVHARITAYLRRP
jgi:glycerol-3-phosphate O-acyltransferase